MEYVDDKDEIEESLAALDRIKDWAYTQMGRRRKPEDHMSQMMEPEGVEGAQEEAFEGELEQPMSAPPPPSYGQSKKPGMDVEIEVITPGDMAAKRGQRPPQRLPDDGMKKWTNDTINKLDKFGRKMKRR